MDRRGVEIGGKQSRALKLAQGLTPLGRMVLPRLPERPCQFMMGEALGRWPQLWGLSAKSRRMREAHRAFELAFPDEDADELMDRWVRARGRGMGLSLSYLSRWIDGRPSRLVRASPDLRLPEGPSVVAFLHYMVDPTVQLACISTAGDDLRVRWPIYPILPGGTEDDRELWISAAEIPPRIAETLLPITDPRWVGTAFDHLQKGGTVFLSIDAPLDSNRGARFSIPVGQARLPIAPSIELFARVEGVQLALAWPRPRTRSSWVVDIEPAASVDELTRLAGTWIESHHQHWSGWRFLVWRENAMSMRENVMKTQAGLPH